MRLQVDLRPLFAAVERMGAPLRDEDLGIAGLGLLQKGIDVSIDEVARTPEGLLHYRGHQIVLYIADHRSRIQQTLAGTTNYRFHVADCDKLKEMRAQGRYKRYRVTNDLSGEFEVCGVDPVTGEKLSGRVRLQVCYLCLQRLNYQGFNQKSWIEKKQIQMQFSLPEFFARYRAVFAQLPEPADHTSGYTADWKQVAARYKRQAGYRCESCGVDLSHDRQLLHVHHKNGVTRDNHPDNLQALCLECHRDQFGHGHLTLSGEDRARLRALRRQQGIRDP